MILSKEPILSVCEYTIPVLFVRNPDCCCVNVGTASKMMTKHCHSVGSISGKSAHFPHTALLGSNPGWIGCLSLELCIYIITLNINNPFSHSIRVENNLVTIQSFFCALFAQSGKRAQKKD